MTQKISFLLCSTLHDPQFRLKSLLKSALPIINKLFLNKILCCTPSTAEKALPFLTREGFEVNVCHGLRQIDTYKLALKTTLNFIDNPLTQKIFYIDIDRLIHWANTYPEEIIEIFKKENVDYLHMGRTPRAFNTHPSTQKDTEIIVNEIGSKVLGFSEIRDIISVCSIFSKELGEKILKVNNNSTATGFYGTWPIIFWTLASTKQYIEVEGLEWETPDRFNLEIKKNGYDSWLKQFQNQNEWKKRIRFVREFLFELNKLIEFKFVKN